MDFAIDFISTKTVGAAEATPDRVYRCPVCDSRVVLRGYGQFAQRRSHFAHVKNQARPDCENYHPSFYLPAFSIANEDQRLAGVNRPYVYVGEPELYLKETSIGFDLEIVIPGRPSEPEWSGAVLFQGRFGEQTIGFSSLLRPFEALVFPQKDRYVFSRRGEVGELFWGMLRDGIRGLKFGPNCFRQSEVRGRRLATSEKLFWGDRYWMVSPTIIEAPGSVSHYLLLLGTIGEWSVFELALPSEPNHVLRFEKDDIRTWVGHEIHERGACAYLIDPLPHHFDEQGVFVLSKPVSTVRVALDAWYKNVLILDGKGDELVWQLATDDSLIISLHDANDAFVYVDNTIVLAMRFESCELFAPQGLRLKANDQEVELFSKEAEEIFRAFRSSRKTSCGIALESCNERVLKLLMLNGAPMDSHESLLTALCDGDHPFEVNASNFGRVCLPSVGKNSVLGLLDPWVRDRGKWLLSLPFPAPSIPSCRFPDENGPNTSDWVRPLRTRTWGVAFEPHLHALAYELRKAGCL